MRTGVLALAILITGIGTVQGRTIYVDSRVGNDAYDGTSAQPINAWVGPVRTLERAMRLIQQGDTLVLVDNGTPYYGSLTLFGSRCSGTETRPFRLVGGGAVISGTKPIHPDSWAELGNNLWRITPLRKGWYQLAQNDAALPRIDLPPDGDLSGLPAGSWGVSHGAIFFRSEPSDSPRLHDFALAETGTGLTLLGVRNVVISDVTFRHFRIDGICAHDRCAGVTLDNVSCIENGRAGLCVAGTSRLTLTGGHVAGNAQHSLLITELGEAAVSDTDYDTPPTLAR